MEYYAAEKTGENSWKKHHDKVLNKHEALRGNQN